MLDKEKLIELIAAQSGKTPEEIELDEETLGGLLIDDPAPEPEPEPKPEPKVNNKKPAPKVPDIDTSNLDETVKQLYEALMEERARASEKELELMIKDAGLSEKNTKIIKRMADNGVDIEAIEESIKDLAESEKESKGKRNPFIPLRRASGSSRGKSTPRVGTRENGERLAALSNKSRGGK